VFGSETPHFADMSGGARNAKSKVPIVLLGLQRWNQGPIRTFIHPDSYC